jgi:hypothetical protein
MQPRKVGESFGGERERNVENEGKAKAEWQCGAQAAPRRAHRKSKRKSSSMSMPNTTQNMGLIGVANRCWVPPFSNFK